RESVAVQRSSLAEAMVPLVKPLSTETLTGAVSTSDNVPTTAAVTAALSATFTSTSLIPPITIDDYEITSADG
ncbi:hypothetical protein Tco_0611898, partial [Tanacetum coccineum]